MWEEKHLCRLSDEVIQSKFRTTTLDLSVFYLGTEDQPIALSTPLDVQSAAAKRIVQLG